MNREEWLNTAISHLRPIFSDAGIRLPKTVCASVGWPSSGLRSTTIAESWPKIASRDRVNNIFVSPQLGDEKSILTVLVHELVHVSLDCADQHGRLYQDRAARVGLVAPWRESIASDWLSTALDEIREQMPEPYPSNGFKSTAAAYSFPAKNYQVRVECPGCGYLIRTTQKWISTGLPTCACGEVMEAA